MDKGQFGKKIMQLMYYSNQFLRMEKQESVLKNYNNYTNTRRKKSVEGSISYCNLCNKDWFENHHNSGTKKTSPVDNLKFSVTNIIVYFYFMSWNWSHNKQLY